WTSAMAFSAQVDPDALRLGVEVEPGHAGLPSEAGSLGAAVRGSGVVEVVGVDPDRAGLEHAGRAVRFLHVARPDRGAQAIEGIVGLLERLVEIVEGDHRENRPEDLLAGDGHGVRDVVEDGGLPEPAASVPDPRRLSTHDESCTLLLS